MHRALFHATVIVLGFALAAGAQPQPDKGDQGDTQQLILPAGPVLDLLWWIRR